MEKSLKGLMSLLAVLVFCSVSFAQKADLKTTLVHKWRVIWYSDDGEMKNMEAKKQHLHLRGDGTGTMYMLGEEVGPVTWSVVDKKHINFSDDPAIKPYLVTVKSSNAGLNVLFTGTMPNGVQRKVFFEFLSGTP